MLPVNFLAISSREIKLSCFIPEVRAEGATSILVTPAESGFFSFAPDNSVQGRDVVSLVGC